MRQTLRSGRDLDIPPHVPDWLEKLREQLASPGVLIALLVLSGVTFLASLIGVPFFLSRMPQDYFSRRERVTFGIPEPPRRPGLILLRVLRNGLGVLLIVLGLLMLVLPGQGILTLLVGLSLADFPGKHRLERWVIGRPAVFKTINALRRRAGQGPLEPRSSWLPPKSAEPPQ